MPFQGNGWRPTRVTRFIQGFATAAGTVLVDTDCGEGYLKALGNPEGPHALACEYVGSMLAEWLGLTTLDFSLINVTEDEEIPFLKGGVATPGPAFISRAEPTAFPWGGDIRELRSVTNPNEFSGLVVLDTWTLNYDRHAPDGRRVNRDNVLLIQQPEGARLYAMDFTHAFRLGGDISRKTSYLERIRDERIFGLFPEFQDFLDREQVRRFTTRLVEFSRGLAEQMIASVPQEWEVGQDGRSAWATLIGERARFIAAHIETILWPQLELEGGTE